MPPSSTGFELPDRGRDPEEKAWEKHMQHLSSDGLRGLDRFTNASTNNDGPGLVHPFASLDEDFDRTFTRYDSGTAKGR
jgi:hypothetical protein